MTKKQEPKQIGGGYKVLNFFWIILFGIWATVFQVALAIVFMVTIIGIPNGIALFHTLKILWHPWGRQIRLHYGSHPVLNTIWVIFLGWINPILLYIVGGIFCVFIVTIPIALQIFKLAAAYWAPHGVELYVA